MSRFCKDEFMRGAIVVTTGGRLVHDLQETYNRNGFYSAHLNSYWDTSGWFLAPYRASQMDLMTIKIESPDVQLQIIKPGSSQFYPLVPDRGIDLTDTIAKEEGEIK